MKKRKAKAPDGSGAFKVSGALQISLNFTPGKAIAGWTEIPAVKNDQKKEKP